MITQDELDTLILLVIALLTLMVTMFGFVIKIFFKLDQRIDTIRDRIDNIDSKL